MKWASIFVIPAFVLLSCPPVSAECTWEIELYDYDTKKSESFTPAADKNIELPLDPEIAKCHINPVTTLEEGSESLLIQCSYPETAGKGFEIGVIAHPDVPGRGALGISSSSTEGRRYRIFAVGGNC